MRSSSFRIVVLAASLLMAADCLHAQLCTGSLGDPVINITFGAGSNPGGPLAAATTNYSYTNTDCPNDGQYTIRNQTTNCFSSSWYSLTGDHTGDPGGYFMLVNASFTPSDFYLQKVDGLCGNTTYEFAAWILNLLNYENSIKPNITFQIEKTDGTVLGSFNSGDIPVSFSPQWKQYGFYFKTPSNVSSVVIRMTNNAPGGRGNDLALDDITFRPCGPLVNASIGGLNTTETSVCENDPVPFTFNAFVSTGYTSPVYIWQLSTDNGTTWKNISGATSTTYVRAPTAKGKYIYRMAIAENTNSGISSCTIASNIITVNVNPVPTVKLVTDNSVCAGSNITLKASVTYNSRGPWTNIWTYPDPNANVLIPSNAQTDSNATTSVIIQSIKASMSSAGKYVIKVQNAYGCSNADSVSVIVNPRPVAGFSYSSLTCEKKSILFSDASSGNAAIQQWNWEFGDGSVNTTDVNPSHVYTKANNYSVHLVVKDAKGCLSDTVTKAIAVHPTPQTNFGLPEICLSDPYAAFTDSTIISDHSEGQFLYLWKFGDPSSGSGNTSLIKNPLHKYSSVGNYSVQLTVTSGHGCAEDSVKLFTVNGVVPKAVFSLGNASPVCSMDPVSIIDKSTVDFGNIVKVEIFWDDGNNPTLKVTDDNPSPGKLYSYDYSALVTQPTTDFRIRYIAYSGISCVSQATQTIIIHKSPVVQFDPVQPVCEESPAFKLTQAIEISGSTGSGIFTGKGIGSNGLFSPSQAGAGVHAIRYTFTTTDGCSNYQDQDIQVYPQPGINAGPDKIIIKGGAITLHATASGKNLTYLWTPNTFMDNPSILTPKIAPVSDITYSLKVTSSDGCTNQDDVTVKVASALFVPNAFTPDGDGKNDSWRLPSLESFPGAEIWVYNRWGQLLYHSTGANVSWNGTFNGKLQPSGTYVYLIDIKNGSAPLKGTFTLIR